MTIYQDRTDEFLKTVSRLSSTTEKKPVPAKNSTKSRQNAIAQHAQFTTAAQGIMQGIHGTSERLEQLTALVRQSSLFSDNNGRINQLQYLLKQDISTLRGEIDVLSEFVGENTSRGSDSARADEAVVDSLKMHLAGTAKGFQSVLKLTTEQLKSQYARRAALDDAPKDSKVSSNRPTPAPTSQRRGRNAYFQALLDDDDDGRSNDEQEGLHARRNGNASDPLLAQEHVAQENKGMETYLTQRAEAVDNITDTIQQLGGMYKDLIEIVDRQKEVAIRIDSNMDNTLENVRAGQNELVQYFNRVSGGQWLILKVFAVLIMFALFFVTFIA